jgi:signal transduction histidine kinase
MPASKRPAQRRSRFRLPSPANARIRSKLGLILVVPIAAILMLTALRLVDANGRASDADRVGALTSLSADVSQLAHQVHRERMAAAVLLASPTVPPDAFNKQTAATDAAVASYTAKRQRLTSVPVDVGQRLQRIDDQLGTITKIRKEIGDRSGVSVDQVILRYGVVIEDLISYREVLSQVTGDAQLADSLRAAAAFSKAKARLGDEQALTYTALKSGTLDNQQFTSFLSTLTAQQEAFVAFSLAATPDQRSLVASAVTGDAVQLSEDLTNQLRRSNGQATGVRVDDALGALGAVDDLMRWTEQQLDASLVANAATVSASVQRQALVESVIVVVVLAIVIALALIMARSMIRSLRRLRQAALAVAEHDLPETVAKLRDAQSVGRDTPDQMADQVRDPIELNTRDEIGEVARAFNIVHREAVRVAAEQAVLRTSVSAMFLGLARRSQTLVDRMIGQLDRIERTEEDPARLAELFQLDHLATRMRRNDENVLVLADSDSTPPRREDAPLVDVMRAAQSEIEMYQRVEFGTLDEDVLIAAHAVNDVVRLLAELVDNATRFSPPTGSVVLDGRRLGDRALIQIEDNGLGMSPEMVAEYNGRLATPQALDVTTFRMMGLAVVGRLAHRHAITVQIRDRQGAGTVVEVMLPSSALILPKARGFRQLPAEAPANIPRSPAPFGSTSSPTSGAPLVPRSAPVATVAPDRHAGVPAYSPAQSPPSLPVRAPQQQPPVQPVHAPTPPVHTPPVHTPTPPVHAPSPPPWPVRTEMPVATTQPGTAINRWADLLTEPVTPSGPGTNTWQLHDDTTELPIFREIEAVWFQTRRHNGGDQAAPASSPVSTPMATQTQPPPMPAPPPPMAAPASTIPQMPASTPLQPRVPSQRSPVPDETQPSRVGASAMGSAHQPADRMTTTDPGTRAWRTRADDGWRAAEAAAAPPVAGTTRSGLPKRAPQAQLVPGGVTNEPAARVRRTPDEVRGLLSTYHRGVRRGRAATGSDGGKSDGGSPPSNHGSS